ncbi:hypothetical protein [Paraburkholderia lycopersici]|uniref:Uncharacterized protein n=1 Tax=Paraburkholderia lycopersici TaxID=416944 RepID=A0A1G6XKF2_9BURK|nr:hypothetical protein SAMN05421548_12564 [Paraburkholderia lycopersici]
MPAHPHADARPALADTAATGTLSRSLGQIALQAQAGTGACLLAALALADWRRRPASRGAIRTDTAITSSSLSFSFCGVRDDRTAKRV